RRHLSPADVMARDRQRLGQCGEAKVEPGGQLVQRERRDGPGRLQASGSVDAEETEVPADVTETAVASGFPTRIERTDDDGIAHTHSVDTLADLRHRPRR